MLLVLGIKTNRIKFHAMHGKPVEIGSIDEFLALPEVQRTIRLSERFGDGWRVIEENPDPNKPNRVVHNGNNR